MPSLLGALFAGAAKGNRDAARAESTRSNQLGKYLLDVEINKQASELAAQRALMLAEHKASLTMATNEQKAGLTREINAERDARALDREAFKLSGRYGVEAAKAQARLERDRINAERGGSTGGGSVPKGGITVGELKFIDTQKKDLKAERDALARTAQKNADSPEGARARQAMKQIDIQMDELDKVLYGVMGNIKNKLNRSPLNQTPSEPATTVTKKPKIIIPKGALEGLKF